MISPKQEIDETVNFANFGKLFTNKFAAFFVAFFHPIFKRVKRNKVTGHMFITLSFSEDFRGFEGFLIPSIGSYIAKVYT